MRNLEGNRITQPTGRFALFLLRLFVAVVFLFWMWAMSSAIANAVDLVFAVILSAIFTLVVYHLVRFVVSLLAKLIRR